MTLIFLRLAARVGLEEADTAGIDLQLDAGLAIDDRHGRRLLAEPELLYGKPVQRRVRHVDALTPQQLADLRQAHVLLELVGDQRSLAFTLPPRVAVLVRRRLLELGQYLAQSRVRQLLRAGTGDDAVRLADLEVAAHSLRIHAELRGDPLLGDPKGPLP